MSLPTVFVCGATGTQGGAVARHLRAKDAEVHAVARDPTSKNAKALEALGVKLWPGDFDNREALKAAIAGCDAVFLNLSPDFKDHGGEIRRAKLIMATAKNAGVKHLVYSSGFAVNAPEKLKNWDPQSFVAVVLLTKQAIEKETRAAGFQYWTILRPGNFMANYLDPLVRMYHGLVDHGVWTTALTKDSIMPMVDPDTIGKFSTAALLDPTRFHAQEIEYADELLVADQVMEKLSKATGRDLKAVYLTDEEINAQKGANPFIAAQYAMHDLAQFVDMNQVRTWGIPLSTFDAFLEREKERVAETYLKKA